MKVNKKIELNEKELLEIITEKVEKETKLKVEKIWFNTVTKGDYDRGTASEHVETVHIKLK